ncbi:MAG: hypothetical protein AADX96_15365 [Thiocapsa sp. C3-sup]|uniref:hypothetical protein n=1 Tax=unclassified Thiocapsa TaxID=2641286 RepID=UPI0035B34AB1
MGSALSLVDFEDGVKPAEGAFDDLDLLSRTELGSSGTGVETTLNLRDHGILYGQGLAAEDHADHRKHGERYRKQPEIDRSEAQEITERGERDTAPEGQQ